VDQHSTVTRSPDQVSALIDGEVVAMRISDGVYLTLDGIGSRVWELVAEPSTFGDLCAALAAEYGVDPPTCERDVGPFLEGLCREGIVELSLGTRPGDGDGDG
jgi:hypothetical protein